MTKGVPPVRRLISRDLPPCAGALFKGSHLKLRRPPRWLKMASTLPDDTAPSASLDRLEAQAAPTHPRAPPKHLGSSPCGLRSPPQAGPRLRILRLPPPGAAVSLLGCDGANSAEDFQQINKAVNYAEMAFDQMQLHA